MIESLRALLDRVFPRVARERPEGIDPWFYEYFGELADPAARRRYARAVAADLALARFAPAGRVLLDAGSGFGVTLLGFAALGARRAVGLEAFAPMARSARLLAARYAPDLPAETVRGSVSAMPLASRSVDFIYCNEALSHFLDPDGFFREAARVLRPEGMLFIADGNNGANRRTVAHVREVWDAFENGPGERVLHGHRIGRPYRERRRELVAAAIPDLSARDLDRAARGTFGLHGAAVVERARVLLATGAPVEEPSELRGCPVDPDKGDHIENLVHPAAVRARLEELGFAVRVHAHFGGARGPLVAAANRVLRALTPITLSRARAVKLVARR